MIFFTVKLPVALIRIYRLIPERTRRAWSMGTSSSGAAAGMIESGMAPWAAIRKCTWGWRFLPGYMLGAAFRVMSLGLLTRLAWPSSSLGVDWKDSGGNWQDRRSSMSFLLAGFLAGLGRRVDEEKFGWLRDL